MSAGDDLELMEQADGERAASAPAIERSAEADTKVAALGQLREVVRGHLELAADAIPDRRFDAMWREVRKSIEVEQPRGVWSRLRGWFERHRGHLVTGVVSAGAVATVALILRPTSDGVQPASLGAIPVQPAALRSAPVVEELDTPNAGNTVLNIEDEDGHMTMIIVTPADTVEGI